MALGKYDDLIWLGSGGDFADASALAGVKVAVLVGEAQSYAHTNDILQITVKMPLGSTLHDAQVKALVKSLQEVPVALCGNPDDAAFTLLLAGIVADKTPASFDAALVKLKPRGMNLDKDPEVLTQGKRIWP